MRHRASPRPYHGIARARLLRQAAAAAQQLLHARVDPLQDRADLVVGGRGQGMKHGRRVGRGPRVHAVEHEGVQVEVQHEGVMTL